MNILHLKLTRKLFPYPENEKSRGEIWGNTLITYDQITILDQDWDINQVIIFFEENKQSLLTEVFPYNNNISIAEEAYNLYEIEGEKYFETDDDDVSDKYFNSLYEYFSKHRFHLEGIDTPRYLIGLKTNGLGEISYFDTGQYYSYFFDMKLFISNVENEIQRIKNEIEISG